MEKEYCPILPDCPVYLNNTTHNEIVGITYRKLYCLQVNKKYKGCKRYQAYLKFDKVPRNLMPNSKDCLVLSETSELSV